MAQSGDFIGDFSDLFQRVEEDGAFPTSSYQSA